jgi:hypothetical protein
LGNKLIQILIESRKFIFGNHHDSDFNSRNAKSYKDFMKKGNGEVLAESETGSARRGSVLKTAFKLV